MSNLFKKAAFFTDIHYGLKSNSLQHNQDCVNFVDWFIAKAKKENCERRVWHITQCLFLIFVGAFILTEMEQLKVFFYVGNFNK